jgi:hypothetical protein
MLLTISTTHRPATDLGPLLHRQLDTIHSASFPFGQVLVCFSQADENRCTAGVMLQAHPVLPSYLAVALAEVFTEALRGRPAASDEGVAGRTGRSDEVAGRPLPFEVELPALPCPGGPTAVRRLFGPLGYHVAISPVPTDPRFPAERSDGDLAVHLTGIVRLADLLSHLCVLLPVLDDRSVPDAEHPRVDHLVAQGEPWLGTHPEAELIIRRYATQRPRRARAG